MSYKQGLYLLALTAWVTGCVVSVELPPEEKPMESVLGYYQRMVISDQEARTAEIHMLSGQGSSMSNTVKLALLTGMDGDRQDIAQAINLLSGLPGSDGGDQLQEGEYRQFGIFWLQYLQTLRSLQVFSEQLGTSQEAYRNMMTAYEGLLVQTLRQDELLAGMQRNTLLLEKQNSLLLQQLQALTAIEQQLVENEQAEPGRQDDNEQE